MRVFAAVALLCIAVLAAPPRFEPVQAELLSTGGTLVNAWADYDGDGDLDLFVGFNSAPNRLYRNDAGVLVEIAASAGVADARPNARRPGVASTAARVAAAPR